MFLKRTLTHNLLNIPGWRTRRKIVVIESDDWGAIRMPSKKVYDNLLRTGFAVDKHPYERYDSLATETDLHALFEVLLRYKDRNGKHPVITANCVVANPDFEKIRQDDFEHYYFEPITITMQHYKGCENSFSLWQEGRQNHLFQPQFHGREHLNVACWLNVLQSGDKDNLFAFEHKIMGIFPKDDHLKGNIFQVALDDSIYKGQSINDVVIEGLDLFEKLLGYRSKTFIAPCYTWNPFIEKTLFNNGISGIQGIVYQYTPKGKRIRHWMGAKNSFGQIYTIRNCFFEPTISPPNVDNVSDCLCRIKCAFRWHKPAIISTHRVNFIGSICEKNRTKNLSDFDTLLNKIIVEWPDVEFLTSDQLVTLICDKNENSNS